MAERRMFAKTIIGSDAFCDMPATARLLYYDLGMMADDDGFVNSPKKIMRMTGATSADMDVLVEKKFVIRFEDGIVAIKHWRINNEIKKDRYTETKYVEDKRLLQLDENKAYRLIAPEPERNHSVSNVEPERNHDVSNVEPERIQDVSIVETECIQNGDRMEPERRQDVSSMEPDWNQNGNNMETQVRLDKIRLDKGRIEQVYGRGAGGTENSPDETDADFLAELEKIETEVEKKAEKAKKKPKEESIDSVIDSYELDADVKKVLREFADMRKKKKRPLTARAMGMVIKKLTELAEDSETQVKIVEQSILHTWDTVYALKDESPFPRQIRSVEDVKKIQGNGHYNPFLESLKAEGVTI